MSVFGDYLKKRRVQSGLSLKEVQNRTGISNSRLCRIENGSLKSDIPPRDVRLLAEVYSEDLVSLYLLAGYLTRGDLQSYEQIFRKADLLNEDEKRNIQEQIDLFTKGR